MAQISVVDFVGVDAVPDTEHEGCLFVINHEVVLELLQSVRIEEPYWSLCLFHNHIFEESKLGFVAFPVEDKNETNDVSIAFLSIAAFGQLQQFSFLLVDVLGFEPFSDCLCSSFSLIGNRSSFILGIEKQNSRKSLDLIFSHELLVLTAVDPCDVDSLADHSRQLAIFWFEISAVAALSQG